MEAMKRSARAHVVMLLGMALVGCRDAQPPGPSLSATSGALSTSTNEPVLGFEDETAWTVTQGVFPPPLASDVHTEGAHSLAVNPSGYGVLSSAPMSVLSALSGDVSFDLFVPSVQANRYWFGAVQLYLTCASRAVFNAFVGQVELTGLETDRFHRMAFSLSNGSTLASLSSGCADLTFSIALNVPWNESGTYLLDNLHVATAGDHLSPVLSCVFTHDDETYYARFSYLNDASAPVIVPVGPENSFTPGPPSVGQPETFPPGSPSAPFTVVFDGSPLSWHLGEGVVTASADSPRCPSTWISAWTGRGPLSTTITTNKTFLDPVPTLTGRTLRLMSHLTTGGTSVRVRFSQRFSTDTLTIDAAHVAIRSTGSAIAPETDRTLTFGGSPTATIPGGADVWSDPVALTVSAGQDLAISLYSAGTFVPTTEGGRGGVKTSYHKAGNLVSATSFTSPSITRQIFAAYEVQVFSPGPAATLVALGDSITEGACSNPDANGDWPDLLAARLPYLPDGTAVAVANEGIGSGRFASSDGAGLRGLTRLDEVLTLPEVRWVTLLMGVNDISYEDVDAAFLEDAYSRAILKAHAAGKKIIGIPILPFGTSVKDVGDNVQVAQDVNAWVRAHDRRLGATEPTFDAVLDFEPAVVDPTASTWSLRADLTCDHVHPNQAGYSAIAAAIPLDVFQ
jgi:lysophospholipase L1-like esterase